MLQMSFPDNQQVIEAFSPDASQEPFADRIGHRSALGVSQLGNSLVEGRSAVLLVNQRSVKEFRDNVGIPQGTLL
jgi:hypothetical protein